jgi:dipeptidyl aminopeptidase/acylaminoacyl peptidase
VALAPYGSWESPITAELLTGGASVELTNVGLADDGVYWLEGRPHEGGRAVLVFKPHGGQAVDVVPRDFNVRSRVHEYGGGAYWVYGSTAYCSSFADGRIYRFDYPGAEPRSVTPEPREPNALRYADGVVSNDGRTIVCVRERHEDGSVINDIVALPADGSSEPRMLLEGRDFYAWPRFDTDSRRLAWTAWDHPRMPFDGTDLCVGEVRDDGTLEGIRRVAGGETESVVDPQWSPDGQLIFVSDRSGWWNLYAESGGTAEALCPVAADFGYPQWVFGISTYAFLPDGRIACVVTRNAEERLELLDARTGELRPLELPFTMYNRSALRARGTTLAFVAGGPTDLPAVVTTEVDGSPKVVRRSIDIAVDERAISIPEAIDFPGADGEIAHGFFYPPANSRFEAPPDELPPLLVVVHGGPTSHATTVLDLSLQYFTSRGIAVVKVNYGGSTGYGREYRRKLNGRWGEVDVEDSVAAARFLGETGRVDPERVAIAGGSAGGYTALLALALRDEFAAGISEFGVADVELLALETHKFESHYEHSLIGPYPELADLYRARSPLTHADRIDAPLLILQGLDDKVVPPAQAEAMVDALRRRGVPYAYLAFAGEGHGFRRAETQRRAMEAELSFLGQVFAFEPADELEPIRVENLTAARH